MLFLKQNFIWKTHVATSDLFLTVFYTRILQKATSRWSRQHNLSPDNLTLFHNYVPTIM